MSYWDTDNQLRQNRADSEKSQSLAKQDYDTAMTKRLDAIRSGGSPSAMFSPWLALQQEYANQRMQAAERDLPGSRSSGWTTPQAEQRDVDWDKSVKDAQAIAARAAEMAK